MSGSAPQIPSPPLSRALPRSKGRVVLWLTLSVVILAVTTGIAAWYFLPSKKDERATPAAPERVLNYGLTVQKMRNGRPYQEPFVSSGQEIFESGWKFRMDISSPQSGCLYLVNEGPSESGEITYNMLFPAPGANFGSPYLDANQKIHTGWMVFVEGQGTENFWMIWAAEAVPELEAVKDVVNDKDKGAIRNQDQANAVREFLARHASPKPDVETDRTNKRSSVKTNGQVLVSLLELEHH
jgi:hypothetical protein